MDNLQNFRPAWTEAENFGIQLLQPCPITTYRTLYQEVGTPFGWNDRTDWSDEQLVAYLAQPNLFIWVSYWDATLCGYIELRTGIVAQIIFLGLFPGYYGRGLGRHLLSVATLWAWNQGCSEVRVNTLSSDGEFALANYLRRGFRIERQVEKP
jgi:ribosomal protein S18 acetylase RimI-like enzyme